MLRQGVTLDKDQVLVSMARERSIKEAGRKFIAIRLIDFTKNRIQGAIVLHSRHYMDENNLPQFKFEERGGPIIFEMDEFQGAMYARLLDCDHNRRFLASMSSYNYWEIEDKEVEAEILKIAEGMTKKAIIKKAEVPKESVMSDDQIELEMARLQSEKSKRTLKKADIEKPTVYDGETHAELQEPKAEDQDTTPNTESETMETLPAQEVVPETSEPPRRGRAARRRKQLVSVE